MVVTSSDKKLCKEPRSYQVTTSDNVTYRKTQSHLKLYKPENKAAQDAKSCNMQPLEKTGHKTKSNDTIANLQHRRTIKAPVKLEL